MDTKIIFGFILGLIGSFVGAFFAHCFSEYRRRKEDFNKAAALFRTTFTDEQRELKGIFDYAKTFSEDDVLKMLKSSRTKFENACINFRVHIDKSQRISFDNAWKEYCHPKGCDPKQVPSPFTEYFIDMSIHDSINLIIEKMEKLLSFAKPT